MSVGRSIRRRGRGGRGTMKVFRAEGVLKCDEPTIGGRIYPRRVVQAALDRVQDCISRRRFIGPIGGENPQRLSEASFVVTKAEIGEAGLSIEVEPIMELGRGRELAAALESGEAAFYSVGEGIVRDGVVQDGYILLGFGVGWKEGPWEDGGRARE